MREIHGDAKTVRDLLKGVEYSIDYYQREYNTQRSPLAQRLKKGLVEGIEFARGDLSLATTAVPTGRSFSGEEVAAIRNRRHMSQAQFANLLAVNVKTLQSWEQGVRKPSKPTMRLLQIFDAPEEFRSVLSLAE